MFTQLEFNQDVWLNLSLILFHAVWQGALIGFLLWSLDKIIRRSLPALRYGVFVTGLWLVLLLPIFTWIVTTSFHSESELENSSQAKEFPAKLTASQDSANVLELPSVLSNWNKSETHVPAELNQQDLQSSEVSLTLPRQLRSPTSIGQGSPSSLPIRPEVIGLVWGIGVFLFTFRLLIGTLWIFKISASKTGLDPEIQSRVQRLSQTQQWSGTPRVFVSSKIHEAIVVGYLRPMVLVPLSWTTHLTPETLEAVIIHELTHIRRFDLWMILVQRIAETLLFFHPVVWWISKRISIERELCCDAESVRILDSNLAYAKALEQVAQRLLEQSQANSFNPRWLSCLLSLNFGGQKMELLARIQHVLQLSPQKQVPLTCNSRHGGLMLVVPLMILGIGFSLARIYANDAPQVGNRIELNDRSPVEEDSESKSEETKDSTDEVIQIKSPIERALQGVGVNSDAGLTGQLVLEESNFKGNFEDSLHEKRNGIRIEQENFVVKAKSMQIDSDSKLIRFNQAKVHLQSKKIHSTLEADLIEMQFSDLTDVLSKTPIKIRATSHVTYREYKTPDSVPKLLEGDEFEWDLEALTIQMRDSGTAVNVQKSSNESKESMTTPEWNRLHEEALEEVTELAYPGFPLKEALTDIGKHRFWNRLVVDEKELQKSGISLQQEVHMSISGVTLRASLRLLLESDGLSFYIDDGNFVVTSALKATHHRVSREYDVSKILKHDEFFQHPHPVSDPEERIQYLVEYLDIEPNDSIRSTKKNNPAVQFDRVTQRVKVVTPQRHQDRARERIELLRENLRDIHGSKFPFLSRKLFSTFRNQHNVIETSLLEINQRQEILTREEEIRKRLQQTISVNFQDRPLSELMQFVASHAGMNIVIDERALQEVGISSKESITVHLEKVSVSTALDVVLQSYGLDSIIEDEVLKVTSRERIEGRLLVVAYRVEDLFDGEDDTNLELERLIATIRLVISPESWDELGGSGSTAAHLKTKSLIVRQNRSVHNEIEWLLQEIRNVRTGKSPSSPPVKTFKRTTTEKELQKPAVLDLENASLLDAMKQFQHQTGTQFYLDQQGLGEAGASVDTKVTFKMADAVMRKSLLLLLLDPLGLGYRAEDGLVVISSKKRCAEPLRVQLYSTKSKHFERRGLKNVCDEMKSEIDPETWDIHGGEGVATFDSESKTLIIRQSEKVHKQITEYLNPLTEKIDERFQNRIR